MSLTSVGRAISRIIRNAMKSPKGYNPLPDPPPPIPECPTPDPWDMMYRIAGEDESISLRWGVEMKPGGHVELVSVQNGYLVTLKSWNGEVVQWIWGDIQPVLQMVVDYFLGEYKILVRTELAALSSEEGDTCVPSEGSQAD